ncbi:hypothetical protein [Zoogloea sp.]|uniref:hypothetical protein n=1 Tax=Zoogloea sp. TaxID=49181 RepID=UPI002632A240|nr:hypothetical protein [Zoogloea sp.]MDD3353819.1 hypothetical protein [Zoogloea sp.]
MNSKENPRLGKLLRYAGELDEAARALEQEGFSARIAAAKLRLAAGERRDDAAR